jgi:hypothetical protein
VCAEKNVFDHNISHFYPLKRVRPLLSFIYDKVSIPMLSGRKRSPPWLCELSCFYAELLKSSVDENFYCFSQEGDIRKFLHTILENRHFVTEPRPLEGENQNGPLETPVPREKTLKSVKSGIIPAKNGLSDQTESNNGKDTLRTTGTRYPSHMLVSQRVSENFLDGIFDFLHRDPVPS